MAKTPEIDLRKNYIQNYLINSNFDFWQRATSFTTPSSGATTADRFVTEYDGTIGTFTVSRQAFSVGQTAVPNEPKFFYRWDHTAAGSGSSVRRPVQRIEDVRTLAGKTVTISFYAKADTTRSLNLGVRQFFGSGGSALVENAAVATFNLTTSFQKFSATYAIPSIAGKTIGSGTDHYLGIQWNLPVNTTMTIDLAQVQINEGSEALPYSLYAKTLAQELIACQRYYEMTYSQGTAPGSSGQLNSPIVCQIANSAGNTLPSWQFKVVKRVVPTMTTYNPQSGATGSARDITNSADRTTSIDRINDTGVFIIVSGGVSAGTTMVHASADAEI